MNFTVLMKSESGFNVFPSRAIATTTTKMSVLLSIENKRKALLTFVTLRNVAHWKDTKLKKQKAFKHS